MRSYIAPMGVLPLLTGLALAADPATSVKYPVVDTAQDRCYDARQEIPYPKAAEPFFGQDAQFAGVTPSYRDNHDGTVTDLRTGLMWQRDPGAKVKFDDAVAGAAKFNLAGHHDWRLPTIKELYSLMDFRGTDPRVQGYDTSGLRPFIDTNFFVFTYGRESDGDRIIDSQYASSSLYVSPAAGSPMGADGRKMFGVNFADGRIKGYGFHGMPGRGEKKFYVMYVRGNSEYGKNDFADNHDGTVTDRATGLTWQQGDSGRGMNWSEALAYARDLKLGGHDDWRLPNAKELQSILDYSRAPAKTKSAAIDPVFASTAISNELGELDFACYWTSTTHPSSDHRGGTAIYLAFGRAMGFMREHWVDVHGAGAQRSDPKQGNPADFPKGRGPQGDAVRILNFVRCVRGGVAEPVETGPAVQAPTGMERPEPPAGTGGPGEQITPQGPRGGGAGRIGFVKRLDRNADGKVSRDEFDGPAEHFPELDRNKDGFLSDDEAPPPPTGGGMRMREQP